MGLFDFLSAGAAGVSDPEVNQYFQTPEKKKGILGFAPSNNLQTLFEDLGDALITANGGEAEFRQRRDAAAMAEALPMLDDPSTAQEALKRIFGLDPKVGADVQKNYYAREKTLADQQAEAAKAQAELVALTRTQALNQLNAGVPRDIVISAASKKGIDVSDLPDDPKIISSMVRGSMAPKDYYQTLDREDDNKRLSAKDAADTIFKGNKLVTDTIRNAGKDYSKTVLDAGRLTKPTGKGTTATKPAGSSGGMIRRRKSDGVIEYRQPDGTYKPK
jgi:hypothetical protein